MKQFIGGMFKGASMLYAGKKIAGFGLHVFADGLGQVAGTGARAFDQVTGKDVAGKLVAKLSNKEKEMVDTDEA